MSTRIVAIDDSELDLRLLRAFHRETAPELPLETFTDPEAFTRVFRASSPLPSLALLDINMTTMSGFELATCLRNETARHDPPGVLVDLDPPTGC